MKKIELLLSDRLRGLRGVESQTAFAARFGLKQAIYSHYETGRKKPSLEVLVDMAQKLGATTDYLLGLSDVPPQLRDSAAPRESNNVSTSGSAQVAIGNNNTQINFKSPPPSSLSSSTAKKKSKRK